MTDSKTPFKYYHYDPSLAAALVFIGFFVITSTFHFYQMVRTRTWYFIPFFIGVCFEWIGYIGRAISSQETPDWKLGPFLIQALFILLGPALFAASIYMELGRIILLVNGEDRSIIKKRWLTKIFVAGDILSFLAQSAGGGIMAGDSKKSQDNGKKIIIIGLVLQILFFGFFIVATVIFDRRMQRRPTQQSHNPSIPWRKHLTVLYIASALILVRNVFRVVEYVQGQGGYLMRHEFYLYVFDGVLMLVVAVVFNVVHPSEIRALLRGGMVSRGLKMVALEKSDGEEPLSSAESSVAAV